MFSECIFNRTNHVKTGCHISYYNFRTVQYLGIKLKRQRELDVLVNVCKVQLCSIPASTIFRRGGRYRPPPSYHTGLSWWKMFHFVNFTRKIQVYCLLITFKFLFLYQSSWFCCPLTRLKFRKKAIAGRPTSARGDGFSRGHTIDRYSIGHTIQG